MNKFLIPAFLLFAAPICGQTPSPTKTIDPAKEKLIREVLLRSKEAEQAQERILQALPGMKNMMPRVEEKVWDKYRQLISVEELRDRLVRVYDEHYSSEELNELLKFYDSPVGKKVSDEAVPILRASMEIAQDLSKSAMQSVAADYQAEQLLQQPRAAGSLGPMPHPADSIASPTPTPTAAAP